MIKTNDFILGVHYHSPFYRDKNGNVYIVSFIGTWLDELSCYFKEIVYIGHQTRERKENQDYSVINKNKIKFYSTGEMGGILTLPLKIYRTRKKVKEIEKKIEGLIVRAPTPRQGTILNAYKGKNKALYLVGEPVKKPLYPLLVAGQIKDLLIELLNRRRKFQTSKLSESCVIISNSMELCRKYEEKLKRKTYFCPSSSLTEKDFFFVEDRCQGQPLKLLFVGRVCRDKGILELIKAAKILKEEGYHFVLNIVGNSGDADKIDDFKKISTMLELDDVINFLGRIPFGKELFKIYRMSDILILPSAHEGFPRVVTEALASGVLVLVTKVGGIKYVLEDKKDVYFIEKEPASIVEAFKRLLADSDLRKKIIKNGYIFANKCLVDKNAKLMTEILEKEWH